MELAVPSTQLSRLQIWTLAARPKTLAATLAPLFMGCALAVADRVFHPLAAIATLGCVILIQVGTNLANDYYDFKKGADTEERQGPIRVTQAGLVTPQEIFRAMVWVFSIAVVMGLYLVFRAGSGILILGLASIVSGILYTAGPYSLAYLGLGDLFVLIFFGPIAVAGTYYVQSLKLSPYAIVAGISPGLLSMAILAVNNLRDFREDKKAGKMTLVVRFGRSYGKIEYVAAVLTALLIPVFLYLVTGRHPKSLIALFAGAIGLRAIRSVMTYQESRELNSILGQTCVTLLLFSILISIGYVS